MEEELFEILGRHLKLKWICRKPDEPVNKVKAGRGRRQGVFAGQIVSEVESAIARVHRANSSDQGRFSFHCSGDRRRYAGQFRISARKA
jgi:hypothetical protein